jgi:hypothetical protein
MIMQTHHSLGVVAISDSTGQIAVSEALEHSTSGGNV